MIKLNDYLLIGIDEILSQIKEPTFFIGDGIALYREKIVEKFKMQWAPEIQSIDDLLAQERDWYPRADHLTRLAYPRFLKKDFTPVDKIVPLYLYPEDCQVARLEI